MKRFYALIILVALTALVSQINFQQFSDITEDPVKPAPKLVKIGVMSSTQSSFEGDQLIAEIALEDINNYCNQTGLPYQFEFLYASANGQAPNAKTITIDFHNQSAEVIVGYGWSSFFCSSGYTYTQENDMVIFSPSSTSPLKAIEDHVFRLCPNDLHQAEPITRMLIQSGVTKLVVIQRNDSWGDGIYDAFTRMYETEGGEIISHIKYPGETNNFTEYAPKIEEAIAKASQENGENQTAILIISLSESVNILETASFYPSLFNVTWYGTDGTAMIQQLVDDVGEHSSKAKIISPMSYVKPNPTFERLEETYQNVTSRPLGFYTANIYDACWLSALSTIEADTSNSTVIDVIPKISSEYNGATGWCLLDQFGDREAVNYIYYAYTEVNGTYGFQVVAYYDYISDSVEWVE